MNDPELDEILRSAAGNEAPLPTDFRRRVWQRIETTTAESRSFGAWMEQYFSILTKPLASTAIVLVMTLAGLALGAGTAPTGENLKSAYVESISPFAQHLRK